MDQSNTNTTTNANTPQAKKTCIPKETPICILRPHVYLDALDQSREPTNIRRDMNYPYNDVKLPNPDYLCLYRSD